jgi:hypothetical protein
MVKEAEHRAQDDAFMWIEIGEPDTAILTPF